MPAHISGYRRGYSPLAPSRGGTSPPRRHSARRRGGRATRGLPLGVLVVAAQAADLRQRQSLAREEPEAESDAESRPRSPAGRPRTRSRAGSRSDRPARAPGRPQPGRGRCCPARTGTAARAWRPGTPVPPSRSTDRCRPPRAPHRCRRSEQAQEASPAARAKAAVRGRRSTVWPRCMPRAMGSSMASACCPRANARSERGRRRLRRENISSPMTASKTTMITPPKARIMCSKRAGTFTNGSCRAMITTRAIASTICSATTEPAIVAVGHLRAHQLEPALQHRDARDLADAGRQQGVEQEADEERRDDMRVVEARLARNGVERRLPHDGLEQDREQVESERCDHPPPGDVDRRHRADVRPSAERAPAALREARARR